MRTLFLAPDGRLRPFWRFALGAAVFVAANFASAVLTAPFREIHGELFFRLFTTLALLAGFSGMLYVFDRRRGQFLAAMGLGRDGPWLRESFAGIALGAVMVTVAAGAIAAFGNLHIHGIGAGRPLATLAGLLALQLAVLAIAAMLEEVAFRGYPFQRLVESVGPVWALIILNGLFGAIHLGNPHASSWGFLNTVAIGIVLGVAYLRTRALWLPWGIHFGWNATLGVAFGLPVSGTLQFQTLVEGIAEGPQWLTGGGYGIEASATGAVVILLGLAGVVGLTPHPPASATAGETNPPPEPVSVPQQS